MAISKKQKLIRQKYLGSSDMAAVMGFDPFRNPADVYLEKTGQLTEQKEARHFARGRYMELALIEFAKDNFLNTQIIVNPSFLEFKDEQYYLISHPDAVLQITSDNIYPIEAKSQAEYSKEAWGDEETDQVPARVTIQCHVHMICMNADICYVPVCLPYRDFQKFIVKYNETIAEEIKKAAKDFWENHVLKEIPPENVTPSLSVVKRLRQYPDIEVGLPQQEYEAYTKAKVNFREVKKVLDEAEAKLLAKIGEEKFKILKRRK